MNDSTEAIGIGHSKCFLVGGYAVLDRSNLGLVLALDPTIKCYAKIIPHHDFKPEIKVTTLPSNNSYTYDYDMFKSFPNLTEGYDRFIKSALFCFFHFHPSLDKKNIFLNIVGDPAFYNGKGKNGLGSSAAVTVSILDSLSKLLKQNDIELFKLASIAHSLAQGNIGSCFDISTALMGSQIYRRPTPSFISLEKIYEKWDHEIILIKPRLSLTVLLISTDFHGSSTPCLIKRFKEAALNDEVLYNEFIAATQTALHTLVESNNLQDIKNILKNLRKIQRKITVNWNVPIVPNEIEEIASHFEKDENVLGVVIPGAGGYDSLALVIKGSMISTDPFKIIAKTVI